MLFKYWKLKRARRKVEAQAKIIQAQMKEKSEQGILINYSKLPAWQDYRKAQDELWKTEEPFKSRKEK